MNDRARLEDNRLRWDDAVPHHVRSAFYDMRGFLEGACTLRAFELDELGDVEGLSLLHLMCHMGQDSLSWARRGARVTGLDFSGEALRVARMLAERLELDASFVQAEVTQAAAALEGQRFDRVYSSWGVLTWVHDLDAWARQIHTLLAPGGIFYLAEVHPVAWLYDAQGEDERGALERTHAYFRHGRPQSVEGGGSYAAPDVQLEHETQHYWSYELGTVISALVRAGLQLEWLHEHDFAESQVLPELIQGDDGMWRLPPGEPSLPLSFSLRARRG
jgi:2-polyprenyl-3-methyl-5-hydroxy-6-metoxy-1,4-benzoquinol methylase